MHMRRDNDARHDWEHFELIVASRAVTGHVCTTRFNDRTHISSIWWFHKSGTWLTDVHHLNSYHFILRHLLCFSSFFSYFCHCRQWLSQFTTNIGYLLELCNLFGCEWLKHRWNFKVSILFGTCSQLICLRQSLKVLTGWKDLIPISNKRRQSLHACCDYCNYRLTRICRDYDQIKTHHRQTLNDWVKCLVAFRWTKYLWLIR